MGECIELLMQMEQRLACQTQEAPAMSKLILIYC